jgi:hypothetical protein
MRVSLLLACVVMAALVPAGHSLLVEYVSERECPTDLAVGRALSNATLYQQVYQWAHHQRVKGWSYGAAEPTEAFVARAGISPEDASKLVCVGVRYGATLELPEPLRSFVMLFQLPGDVALDVEKVVCQFGRLIFEDVLVRDAVVHETRIWTRTEATSSSALQSSSELQLQLPWYAMVLETQIAHALRESVAEKEDALLVSLCDVDAPAAEHLLSKPGRVFQAPATQARRLMGARRLEKIVHDPAVVSVHLQANGTARLLNGTVWTWPWQPHVSARRLQRPGHNRTRAMRRAEAVRTRVLWRAKHRV